MTEQLTPSLTEDELRREITKLVDGLLDSFEDCDIDPLPEELNGTARQSYERYQSLVGEACERFNLIRVPAEPDQQIPPLLEGQRYFQDWYAG